MSPLIFAGVANMIWVKSPLFNSLKLPIDGGCNYKDGKRLFGDNKTWKGFFGMTVLTTLFTLPFALFERYSQSAQWHSLLDYGSRSWPYGGLLMGSMLGLAYVVAELPNSFIKRRLDIGPGENARGLFGIVFTVVDQADSVFGVALTIILMTPITLMQVFIFIVVGTTAHLLINILLYAVGLKKQAR
jgi:CDP-diglyceride synthetase